MNPAGVGQIYIRNPVNTFEVDWKVYFSPLTGSAWIGALSLFMLAPALMTFIVGCRFYQFPTKQVTVIKLHRYYHYQKIIVNNEH